MMKVEGMYLDAIWRRGDDPGVVVLSHMGCVGILSIRDRDGVPTPHLHVQGPEKYVEEVVQSVAIAHTAVTWHGNPVPPERVVDGVAGLATKRLAILARAHTGSRSWWRKIKCWFGVHPEDDYEDAGWGWNRCMYCHRSYQWVGYR